LIKCILILIAASVAVAGCGSETDPREDFTVRASTTVATGPLDRKRFVVRVNRICRKAWVEVLGNFSRYSGWPDQARLSEQDAFAKSVRLTFLAGYDFYVFDEIYNLGGPPEEERQVEEIIGELQRAVELGQRRIRVESAGELTELFAGYNRLARGYGLDDCLVDGERVKRAQA
jgi:hypothetical protein